MEKETSRFVVLEGLYRDVRERTEVNKSTKKKIEDVEVAIVEGLEGKKIKCGTVTLMRLNFVIY